MPSVIGVGSTASAPYVGSLASGLDTGALIEAAVAQRTAPADTIDARITANQARIAAYQEVQSLISAVAESVTALASPTYSALGEGNSFDAKQVFLSAPAGTLASEVIAVSATPVAIAASYDVEVVQLAAAMKIVGAPMAGEAPLGWAGLFSIGVEGATATEIEVSADMSLTDIAAAFNTAASNSGVNATLIRVSGGVFRLALSAADAAVDIVASAGAGDDVLAALGLTDAAGAFATIVQQAQSALVVIDGVAISRDSNELDDVIPGLGLSLLGSSAGQTISISVEADYEGVKTAITDFVEAYNALRSFVSTQNQVSANGVVSEDAVLFADSTLRNMSSLVRTLISSSFGAGAVTSLSDLGVSFASDNTLSLGDEAGLDTLILTDIESIQSFFETSFGSSDPALRLLANTTTRSLDFTLQVSADGDGGIAGVLVDGVAGLFTIEGNRIIGAAGSPYEGLSFALVIAGDVEIDVSLRQGFANQLANLLNAYADPAGGILANQMQSIVGIDAMLQAQADRIRDAAEAYRQDLVEKYAAMETEVQAAQLLQQQIEAILNAAAEDA